MASKVTNAFSTANSLLTGGTTCHMPADKSAYWVPALYKNGNVRVLPTGTSKHILVYYRRGNIGSGVQIQPFPLGLKMILGNQRAMSPAENGAIQSGHIEFKCGPGSGNNQPVPPSQCSSGIMVPIFTFPNCWDGKNLDSANHVSHMAYPSGSRCPSSHPIPVPRIQAYIRYPVRTAPLGDINLASGPYYTEHMDFFNAWEPVVLKHFVDKCINGGIDCGTDPSVTNITTMPSPTPGGGKPGDTDNDGDVDLIDFIKVVGNWGKTVSGGPADGDFDRDGDVDLNDYIILASNWTG